MTCNQLKGDLAAATTSNENDCVQIAKGSDTQPYWLAIRTTDGGATFRNIHNNKIISYANWKAGQPRVIGSTGCVTIESTGQWAISPCSALYNYVCKCKVGFTLLSHTLGRCEGEQTSKPL